MKRMEIYLIFQVSKFVKCYSFVILILTKNPPKRQTLGHCLGGFALQGKSLSNILLKYPQESVWRAGKKDL